MTQNPTISQILSKLTIKMGEMAVEVEENGVTLKGVTIGKNAIDEAEAQLIAYIEEIIGADEWSRGVSNIGSNSVRNELRAEQRARLHKERNNNV